MGVITFDKALQALKEQLVGQAYTEVALGDWWQLSFYNGIELLAQRLTTPLAPTIRSLLATSSPSLLDGVDSDDIPVAVAVLRNRRQPVRSVELVPDGSLVLRFTNGALLRCTTDVDLVDWQWAVNRSGRDPYLDYDVACFWTGKLELG